MALTKQDKNRIKLMNKLNRCFINTFPELKKNPKFKPLRIKDYK